MKRVNILWLLIGFFCSYATITTVLLVKEQKKSATICEHSDFKMELIHKYYRTQEIVEELDAKHNWSDMYGDDLYTELWEIYGEIDSLYLTQE